MQRVIGLVPLSLAFPVGAKRMLLLALAPHSTFILSYLLTFCSRILSILRAILLKADSNCNTVLFK